MTLDKPARVGYLTFGKGVDHAHVITAAQRAAECDDEAQRLRAGILGLAALRGEYRAGLSALAQDLCPAGYAVYPWVIDAMDAAVRNSSMFVATEAMRRVFNDETNDPKLTERLLNHLTGSFLSLAGGEMDVAFDPQS